MARGRRRVNDGGDGGSIAVWGLIIAIAGLGVTLWMRSEARDENEKKKADDRVAAAGRVHQSRIWLNADVPTTGVTLATSYGTWTIDPAPPPMTTRTVTVKIDGHSCSPAATLTVTVNDAQLQIARCALPRGSSGELTWVVKPNEIDHVSSDH